MNYSRQAIQNIMDNKLAEMKNNLVAALTGKAVQKLDEKKNEIAKFILTKGE